MRKIKYLLIPLLLMTIFVYRPSAVDEIAAKTGELDISSLSDYQKEYDYYDYGVCSTSSTKTYMDYRLITAPDSAQYWYIRKHMTVDASTGFLYDEDGFIGVALGSYYGKIGDRYYFTLSNGNVLPLVKIEEKANSDTINGCAHGSDGSVIEFVIQTDYARNSFALGGNGLIASGNYNNSPTFKGSIVKVEKVTGEKNPNYVEYYNKEALSDAPAINTQDIFQYASGY